MSIPDPKWKEYELKAPWFVPLQEHTAHSVTLCGKKIWFLGGLQDGYSTVSAMFSLDLVKKKWSEVQFPPKFLVEETPSIHGQSAVLVDGRIIFIGGFYGLEEEYLMTRVFTFDIVLQEFAYVETYGHEKEEGAGFHSAHYLYETNEIVIYGGESEAEEFVKHPLFSLDVHSFSWTKLKWSGKSPPPRGNHGSCLVGRKIYIFGGFGPNEIVYADMYILDMTHRMPSFSEIELPWVPTRRFGTTLFYRNGQIYMFGGKTSYALEEDADEKIRLYDLCRFSIATQFWYECKSFQQNKHPRRKGNHRGVLVNNRALIFGGTNSSLRKVLEIRFA